VYFKKGGEMAEEKITFSFGKNWEEFIKRNFSEERIEQSRRHLLDFLEFPDLRGKYFLDIGCGSGLHSLAACRAGADRVVSFDVDRDSVKTTEKVREVHGASYNWKVLYGSILDQEFTRALEPSDIVYSWGVLHHTGNMWKAIENTAGLIKDDGLLYIALYTTGAKSPYWLEVKKRYNRSSASGKRLMEWWFIIRRTFIPQCVRLKNPLAPIRQSRQRGMSFYTDVKDWMGGYPYECAKPEEVIRFCRKKLGLELINLTTGEENTEYLFRKK
jgi:SAM-dependent methyltransferase